MALSDSLAEETQRKLGPKCTLCMTLNQLTGEDKKVLANAVDNPLITSTQISRALSREGHAIRPHVIARHRRGECRGSV